MYTCKCILHLLRQKQAAKVSFIFGVCFSLLSSLLLLLCVCIIGFIMYEFVVDYTNKFKWALTWERQRPPHILHVHKVNCFCLCLLRSISKCFKNALKKRCEDSAKIWRGQRQQNNNNNHNECRSTEIAAYALAAIALTVAQEQPMTFSISKAHIIISFAVPSYNPSGVNFDPSSLHRGVWGFSKIPFKLRSRWIFYAEIDWSTRKIRI